MPNTLANRAVSMPLNSIDDVRPQMAHAALGDQSLSFGLCAIVKDALIRHYGSLKAAAITMGMDQGQLTRELQTGDFKLKRLEGTDATAVILATLGRELVEQFGVLTDPKARIRQVIRDIRDRIQEVEQFLDVA